MEELKIALLFMAMAVSVAGLFSKSKGCVNKDWIGALLIWQIIYTIEVL